MTSYIIRAALQEETNNGWIWIALPSRSFVRIRHGNCCAYCEVRDIRDKNFLHQYEADPKRIAISKPNETIVMAKWHREEVLGILKTTAKNNLDYRAELDVRRVWGWWGSLRAACHHPDVVVRLGARLGVLGAGLGILGVVPSVLIAICGDQHPFNDWFFVVAAVLIGMVGCYACRGAKRHSE